MAIQVANHLRRQLRLEYAEGGRLPSENEMAAELGVSRGTVRQALAILQQEGFISRHQGLGTFANPKVLGITARIDFAYEFSELWIEKIRRENKDSVDCVAQLLRAHAYVK